jgi:hypothetical protein
MDRAMEQGGAFAKGDATLAPVEAGLMALVSIGPQSGFITTKATVRMAADLAPLGMRRRGGAAPRTVLACRSGKGRSRSGIGPGRTPTRA